MFLTDKPSEVSIPGRFRALRVLEMNLRLMCKPGKGPATHPQGYSRVVISIFFDIIGFHGTRVPFDSPHEKVGLGFKAADHVQPGFCLEDFHTPHDVLPVTDFASVVGWRIR